MREMLARRWWLFALRGAFAILFGLMALIWPGITLVALVVLWGAYTLVDGATELYLAITHRDAAHGVLGALGVVAGLVALFWPGITALALLVVIAVWAVVGGVLEIVTAVRLRKVIEHERFLALSGVLSVVLGLILLSTPGTGALALVVMIGGFAILWGIVLVLLSLRLRKAAPVAV
ncbi:HdeD family acid-resistance protein [Umezawaea tangerina]|uniref:Uncharacterized membrane protein HdeD (DUF308 family) n=1 Tax=Umezawaea tangerina TaxID=84725 RepID=A0A2T0T9E4_9PSEU|nr:HdeD family acid-resistance protein [Umezawaea tangerina]PRY42274.1 uncharacterized membrane protein HdeD (DUF308 family) [Umezawaea tangerina]